MEKIGEMVLKFGSIGALVLELKICKYWSFNLL